MSTLRKYILVDDDPFNNIISNIEIESTLGEVDIKIFEIPEEGLAFIKNEYIKSLMPTILFLDINMPTLTGWEFMEQYEKFSEEIKNQIRIYILSSSVDPRDKDKAEAHKYIKGFISKPLEHETILSVAGV
jgi:response regulator RpfG family c-di-GMP phosphodiesterase